MKMKKFGNTEKLVYDMAKPIADELGSRIWDVRFEKEGASWYLRVFIDRDEGVSIDDCENVSRPLSDLLDEKDPIPQSYILEVGSAGIERELVREAHFEASAGMDITVKLFAAIDGEKEMTGELVSFSKEGLELSLNGEKKNIPLESVSGVRLHDNYNDYNENLS